MGEMTEVERSGETEDKAISIILFQSLSTTICKTTTAPSVRNLFLP